MIDIRLKDSVKEGFSRKENSTFGVLFSKEVIIFRYHWWYVDLIKTSNVIVIFILWFNVGLNSHSYILFMDKHHFWTIK